MIDQTKEAERSGKEAERAGKEAERAGKEAERAGKEAERGQDGAGGGNSSRVAEQLFRQASELGGFLVVAMIAPIAPSGRGGAPPARRQGPMAQVASKARARAFEAQNAAAGQQDQDRDLIKALAAAVKSANLTLKP